MEKHTELRLGPQGQKLYKLVFDTRAAYAFEEAYPRMFSGKEKGFFQAYSDCLLLVKDLEEETREGGRRLERMRGPSLRELVLMIWALANTHHVAGQSGQAVSYAKIAGEVDAARYTEYIGVVVQAVSAGLPQPAEPEAAGPEAGAGAGGGDEKPPLAAT